MLHHQNSIFPFSMNENDTKIGFFSSSKQQLNIWDIYFKKCIVRREGEKFVAKVG